MTMQVCLHPWYYKLPPQFHIIIIISLNHVIPVLILILQTEIITDILFVTITLIEMMR